MKSAILDFYCFLQLVACMLLTYILAELHSIAGISDRRRVVADCIRPLFQQQMN